MICGNGIVEEGEECDDGNQVNGDGCSMRCAWEVLNAQHCGNGICEVDEDRVPRDAAHPNWYSCLTDCCNSVRCISAPRHTIRCGDAVVEGTELCDDGNTVDGDGCSSVCQPEAPVPPPTSGSPDGGGGSGGCPDSFGSCCDLSVSPDCPEDSLRRDYLGFPVCSRCYGSGNVRYFTHFSAETCVGDGSRIPYWGTNSCAGGHCERGACVVDVTDTCNDSDGRSGDQTYLQGMVTGSSGGVSYRDLDSCASGDPSQVIEYSCTTSSDGSSSMTVRTVPCGSESSCLDGACLHTIGPPRCVQSSVVGGPAFIYGTRENRSQYMFMNYCEADGMSVHAFTCRGRSGVVGSGAYDERTLPCAAGTHCEGGVCIRAYSCTRTEATSTAGFVRGQDGNLQHDLCVLGQLVKFQCDSGGMPAPMEAVPCPSGTTCRDGLCL